MSDLLSNDVFSMGGYGFYVWSSYALFVAVLAWDFITPRLRERATLRRIAMKQRRAETRNTP